MKASSIAPVCWHLAMQFEPFIRYAHSKEAAILLHLHVRRAGECETPQERAYEGFRRLH
jgi:hypothetical protein